MGAYLSSPIIDKISSDRSVENFSYGASSMQGWRKSQEDAHNCSPEFDKDTNTSYFAVYDGHGGAEVAQYCGMHLPDYLKSTEAYMSSNLSQALEDSFLGFDEMLTKEEVIKELKVLADVEDDVEEEDVQGEIEETVMLNEEATMPLEQVLAKYGGVESLSPGVRELYKKNEKIQSPALKGKKESNGEEKSGEPVAGSSSSYANSTVNSNSSGTQLVNGHSENENNENMEREQANNAQNSSETATTSDTHAHVSCSDNKSNPTTDSNLQEQTVSSSDSGSKSEPSCSNSIAGGGKSDISGGGEPLATSSAAMCSEAAGSSSSGDVCSSAGSSSDGISGSAATSASAGSSSGLSGSSSAAQPGGSGSSAVGSSDVDPQPCSSSGRTHKAREHIIPEDDESESSFNSDEEETEEEDSDELCEDDSEDDEDDEGEADEGDGPMFSFVEQPGSNSGTTAVVALLRDRELFVANAGDSRCVVCRGGEAIDMSVDHKPDDDIEKARITEAGGRISWDGRVNGGLNLSRAIGDHTYKNNESLPLKDQMISALPDVKTLNLGPQDEFMVLACDGIWNSMTSAEVVAFVKERMDKADRLSSICEEMFDHCLSPDTYGDGTGCDNMTCIIIKFHFKDASVPITRKRSAVEEDETEDMASKKCKVDSEGTEVSTS
ncbi:protein phosphatase 1G-like isoform X2 [Lineus longissimus]|uniref:protein phosphatase 1G-like isoform X2 n=1 Tax=Lineus longissimus TaxID=88925 RepID=UPI00315CCF8B